MTVARVRPWLPAVLLGGAALLVRAVSGFDGLYGQDSFAYFHYATGPLRQSLQHLQAPPAFFWPPGYPLLVAAASGVLGVAPVAGQLVSIIAAASVPGFTFLLARDLGLASTGTPGRTRPWLTVPLVASLIVAATGQLLQSGIVVMSDTVALAAATGGAWALARYSKNMAGGWLTLSAGAFSFAIISRWIYGLVALPFLFWALLLLLRRGRRTRLAHALAAAAVALLILAPVLIPSVHGLVSGGNAAFAGDWQVYSWSPINLLKRYFLTADGVLSYQLPTGLYYALAPGQWWYFGPVLAALIIPGLGAALRRRGGAAIAVLLAWVLIVYAFHAGAVWQNPRFALAFLPPLAILAAIGFARLWESSHWQIRRLAAAWLTAGVALAATGSGLLVEQFIHRQQDDVATVGWVQRLAPPHAQLLAFGLTATAEEYSRLPTHDLSELGLPQLGRVVSNGRPTMVLVDVANLDRQWNGRPPWLAFQALRATPGLTELGSRSDYTLFAVDTGAR